MKILAINGSPNRDGATAGVMEMLLQECSRLGAECERIHIEDYSIYGCIECAKCKGNMECNLDDDYTQLKARMLDADAVIIGSPYYSGEPVISIKTFIERLTYSAFYKKEFVGKYFVGVATSAVDDSTKLASYCANLGFKGFMGGFIVSGIITENMVLEEGLKDFEDDSQVKNNVKTRAQLLMQHLKTKYRPHHFGKLNFIFNKRINYMIIKTVRTKEIYVHKLKRVLVEKGIIKESKKVSE